MDEAVFWRTMNPHRLHALFDAYFRPVREKPAEPEPQPKSLSEYLMTGG